MRGRNTNSTAGRKQKIVYDLDTAWEWVPALNNRCVHTCFWMYSGESLISHPAFMPVFKPTIGLMIAGELASPESLIGKHCSNHLMVHIHPLHSLISLFPVLLSPTTFKTHISSVEIVLIPLPHFSHLLHWFLCFPPFSVIAPLSLSFCLSLLLPLAPLFFMPSFCSSMHEQNAEETISVHLFNAILKVHIKYMLLYITQEEMYSVVQTQRKL